MAQRSVNEQTGAHTPFSRQLTRRSLLQRTGALAVGAVVAPDLLGGLGRFAAAPADAAALADVSIQLCYLENVQFAGSIMALANGYYKQQGLNVTVLPGGPNLAPEPVVVSGKALVGVTHTDEGVEAIINGAPLKVIGAAFQKSPTCIVSKASHPIRTPQEMIGKTIGVSDTNLPIWTAFLEAEKIKPSLIKVNTVEFSTQPLADGQIDGLMGNYTNEPIALDVQGVPTYAFLLADFGYPIVDDIYIAKTADLADPVKKQQIVGLMKGEALGWKAALASPHTAATLAVDVYGKSLGLIFEQEYKAVITERQLVTTPDTKAHGLFWMSPATVASSVHSMVLGGTKATASMFTNEILTEVYSDGLIV
jgi:ABC-type nitrate/sulfonate/bicarbonate transport system substrate-binding protein